MTQIHGRIYNLDWKNQYCETDHTTQSKLPIQCNSYQNTSGVFHRTRTKKIVKFICKHERPQRAKTILRMDNGTGGLRFPGLMLSYKATVTKTVWYWHKNKHIDQQNRTESPEINTFTCGQLIYNKGSKNIQWRRESSVNDARKTRHLHVKEWNYNIL